MNIMAFRDLDMLHGFSDVVVVVLFISNRGRGQRQASYYHLMTNDVQI